MTEKDKIAKYNFASSPDKWIITELVYEIKWGQDWKKISGKNLRVIEERNGTHKQICIFTQEVR